MNRFGSFFYGTILGVFVLAFFFREVGDLAAVSGAVVGQLSVALCAMFTNTAYLWWNVVGCVLGVGAAVLIQRMLPERVTLSRAGAVGWVGARDQNEGGSECKLDIPVDVRFDPSLPPTQPPRSG